MSLKRALLTSSNTLGTLSIKPYYKMQSAQLYKKLHWTSKLIQAQKLKVIVMLVVLLSWLCTGHGQAIHKHTVYADVSTRGPVYSINYDRIFYSGKKVSYSYRLGFHWLHDEIGFPLGISLITGKKEHHAEFSLTLTPYIDRANYLFRDGNISDKYLYITPGIGYRYQKPGGGLFLKALVAPLVLLDPPSDDFWNMDAKVNSLLTVGAGLNF